MLVASISELRQALREASPDDTIVLSPGEYRGPILIDKPLTLRGEDRRTVLWRHGGPIVFVRAPGVTLDRLLLERTIQRQGPLILHDKGCEPTGRTSRDCTTLNADALISLGDLTPGATLKLPLELTTTGHAEISVAGVSGVSVSPSVLETAGDHLVWMTLDGKAIHRGELLLGEMTVREVAPNGRPAADLRYIWLSGSVTDAPGVTTPSLPRYCLATKKYRLYPSASGLMLTGTQLALLDGGKSLTGRFAYIQPEASGALCIYLPGNPPSPISVNGTPVMRWSRVPLNEGDALKIGDVVLKVQPTDPLTFTIEPGMVSFADFNATFPDPVSVALQNGKAAWKGRVVSALPWMDTAPEGDVRVPPGRSHYWTVQMNEGALDLPNGMHETAGGLIVVGPNQVICLDVRVNVQRPEVSLSAERIELGAVEWGWPVEHVYDVSISNLGRGTWAGEVRTNVPWLTVVTPMPITCEPWSETTIQVRFAPDWKEVGAALSEGEHTVSDALAMFGAKDEPPVNLSAKVVITPPQGHLTVLTDAVRFEGVERNAPLPDAVLPVRNDGAGAWVGSARPTYNWVELDGADLIIEPGTTANLEVRLLGIGDDIPLDTPTMIDQISFESAPLGDLPPVPVDVELTLVELPPYLVASGVNFPPFVKGDPPPEGTLRVYNMGPAPWRGSVISTSPWINVPDRSFHCEPDQSVDILVTITTKGLNSLKIGLNQWDDVISLTDARDPVTVPVRIDYRDAISELYLDTPTLNFGEVDGASPELPTETIRLVNVSPAAWNGRVEVRVPWLRVETGARAFNLEVPGSRVSEFNVLLDDTARWLPPGPLIEDQAIVITGNAQGSASQTQVLSVRALLLLEEWSPLLTISPDKLTFVIEDTERPPQKLKIHNAGSRRWTLTISAAPWLNVSPAEIAIEPDKDQEVEVRLIEGLSISAVDFDPRAIVIIGPGREVEVGVEIKLQKGNSDSIA